MGARIYTDGEVMGESDYIDVMATPPARKGKRNPAHRHYHFRQWLITTLVVSVAIIAFIWGTMSGYNKTRKDKEVTLGESVTYSDWVEWPWWAWGLALGGTSTVSFMVAWGVYNETIKNGDWGRQPVREGSSFTEPVKLRLELFKLSENPLPKLNVIALSPHMALIYSVVNRELGLVPALSNTKHSVLVWADRPISEVLSRKKTPVFFPELQAEIERLQASLSKIGPAQADLPEVSEARLRLWQLQKVYRELPKLVDDNAAKVLALQVLSQVDVLAEVPQSFKEAQDETYANEVARIQASRRRLDAGEPSEAPST